ncbi:MAG: hypothetical protein KDK70_40655, partial [Myxococcales bacterium]|nr:hypothetical protein [Myxococcales bacterium]
MWRWFVSCSSMVALGLVTAGCDDPTAGTTTMPLSTTGIPLPTSGTDESVDTGDKLDVAMGTGETPCAEGGDCGECLPSTHMPCDQGANSMISAVGLNCPGDAMVEVTTSGNPAAMAVRTTFGNTAEWAPREGSAFAVLGSGFINDLDMPTPDSDGLLAHSDPTHCNDDLGAYDPGGTLPAPIQTNDVGGDCTTDDGLLGTGDCSNTIEGQFSQGLSANDYTELRIVAEVPLTNNSVNYDFA